LLLSATSLTRKIKSRAQIGAEWISLAITDCRTVWDMRSGLHYGERCVIRLWFHIRWPGRGCISFQSWNSLNCQCITRQFLYSMLDCEIIWKWVIATQTISWVWILLYIIILFWIWILFWRRTQVSYEEDGVKLTPTIPCSFWTNLGSFGHSWINHFS
jgi:hypothetical protein